MTKRRNDATTEAGWSTGRTSTWVDSAGPAVADERHLLGQCLRRVDARPRRVLANAAFTVFREKPITRAITEIDALPHLSRRISAQSSTIRTCFPAWLDSGQGHGKLATLRLPDGGQYSVASTLVGQAFASESLDTRELSE
jgi:hypothetical protein